jgi:HEPN domain-containing protein
LVFVGEDLRMGELALEETLYNQVCFHAHQAAEKALKALIAYGGSNPPRTHSLTDLLTVGERLEPTLAGLDERLDSLETYYIPARYPDAPPGSLPEGLPGREDAREALVTAREVSDLVRQKVEEDE